MRVLCVFHAGRNRPLRSRERALAAAGVDLTFVVPDRWPEPGGELRLSHESFPVIELPVRRAGDLNRHLYRRGDIRRVILEVQPDLLDLHQEPFNSVSHQWLANAPRELPVVMYSAQNVDKRFPPPFAWYEKRAFSRVGAFYPCSRQAASVLRGKGYDGRIDVIPLGYDPQVFRPGAQSLDEDELRVMFVGRMVPEKGPLDALQVAAALRRRRPCRLILCGEGPLQTEVRECAARLGLRGRVEFLPWQSDAQLASLYARAHVVLVPSTWSCTWTEQFGRVIVEAQASGAVVAGYASGAIPEVGGAAALLASPGDVAGLAELTVRLLENRSEYAQRRSAGLRLSAERAWNAVAALQVEQY